jgi:DEAD/DEAH box helicase domain-containing protein
VPYTTSAQQVSDLRVLDVLAEQPLGPACMRFGVVEVTARVVGFLKRRTTSGEVLGREPLDLPPRALRTKAVWWEFGDDLLNRARVPGPATAGAVHAMEHAAIGLLPLFALCDRWDIGGLSTANHQDTGCATVFIHDGHSGGAGFAERGFAAAPRWLEATARTVAECGCESGCPACVQSPKCGNGNEPLDKDAAVRLLDVVLATAHGRT